MTGNGKIDQAAMVQEVIQRMSQSTSQKSRALAHASPYEQQVAALWCEVLQREQIGLNDNFFEAGAAQSRSCCCIAVLRRFLRLRYLLLSYFA